MKFTYLFSIISVLVVHGWACSDDVENTGMANTEIQHPIVKIEIAKDEIDVEVQTVTRLSCINQGLTGRPIGDCDPAQSKGFRSAHNCDGTGGKYYLCVTPPHTVNCGPVRNFIGWENGECFL